MHKHPFLGFSLTLTAVLMWASLPLAMQQVQKMMDTQTVVWFRFITAFIGLSVILFFSRKLPSFKLLSRRNLWLLLLGIFGLSGNFYLSNFALNFVPPAVSQIMGPISSVIMAFIGIYLFKESFERHQKIGLSIAIIGLIFFFNDRFDDLAQMNTFGWGMVLSVCGSLIWITYSVAQKMLLRDLSSPHILLLIYLGCSLFFTPLATPAQTANLDWLGWAFLIFACLNTLVAYGSYAEALNRWEVTKVSVMMPLIPIFSLLFSDLAFRLNHEMFAEPDFNLLTYIGALITMTGSMLSAAGHKLFSRKRKVK